MKNLGHRGPADDRRKPLHQRALFVVVVDCSFPCDNDSVLP
jgi:hypothetical protein